ncbi:amidophosphoribosyltransferase [Paludicola sp. MB14-C6]|uniref:amidophosphoribosyltransferase n=1 Tax=Paludihabitans sp. MB14-C6 TaxID=3070656 RepID=UPI0027DBBDBF|nr:amidophosphoribosyltransferase [Paludicola sp. MB14-C6]WMJ23219.1 amidophosphoribosyltransferase [Paludicola sp. MB14-C6]
MRVSDKLHEECAVFGVSVKTDEAAGITYNGLLSLQHRGQEGAGIAVISENQITCHKDVGLVSEIFSGGELEKLPKCSAAVGHTRYSTTGSNTKENVGPFITEYLTGRIATAHNGNITNAKDIKNKLKKHGLRFNATSDSEVASSLIAYYMMKEDDAIKGVIRAASDLRGAFSLIILCSTGKLIAVRDPYGYRPLCIGKNDIGIAVASESCALEANGFDFVRDVLPGEIIVIENSKIIFENVELQKNDECGGLCIFEYVYFARPDSIIDNLSVYEARFNMGTILAKEYPVEADVVCGVPDSGLEAAIGYSMQSGIPLVSGFVKNRYIGRSFIYPTQTQRENAVRLKLNPLSANVRGKRIVLVDDSIVRGTTSEKIVRSLKNAGAKEVHLRISSPPFRYTCHYGTDIDNEENLIANQMNINEICKEIGADSLGYISIDGLRRACEKCKVSFCTSCFATSGAKKILRKSELE